MAEKYNLKQELINANDYISGKYDNDPKWETLLGASFLTRPDYINTMRANMFTSHIKQALTLKDPEFPKVWFGPENVVGKTEQEAVAILRDRLGFEVNVGYRDDSSEETGVVLSQDVSGGSKIDEGSTINTVLSSI